MKMRSALFAISLLSLAGTSHVEAKLNVLIIDGQNNHGMWPKTTIMMMQYLEETGLFDIDVERTEKAECFTRP